MALNNMSAGEVTDSDGKLLEAMLKLRPNPAEPAKWARSTCLITFD